MLESLGPIVVELAEPFLNVFAIDLQIFGMPIAQPVRAVGPPLLAIEDRPCLQPRETYSGALP
eukprot:5941143-Pyramimonas_sp.AAC.1